MARSDLKQPPVNDYTTPEPRSLTRDHPIAWHRRPKIQKDWQEGRQDTIHYASISNRDFCQTFAMNAQEIIRSIEREQMKSDLPIIHVGDTVKVGVKIREGDKERIQPYEGVVISKASAGTTQNITVRRVFQGVGVERVFLLHSPRIDSVKVLRRGKVRRAKLYYLRERTGKSARLKQRFDREL
jgi:large subunit ribosomal protein L19